MPVRLVALDDGVDIPLDRAMVVVGRHPQCDARLDSLRVSRHHCCMTIDQGGVLVRDLGSTNGIRINGHRVEFGRLQEGDELSIAHIRYQLMNVSVHEPTVADHDPHRNGRGSKLPPSSKLPSLPGLNGQNHHLLGEMIPGTAPESAERFDIGSKPPAPPLGDIETPVDSVEPDSASQNQVLPKVGWNLPAENALAAAVRDLLPANMADRCRIQVIVQIPEEAPGAEKLEACLPDSPL